MNQADIHTSIFTYLSGIGGLPKVFYPNIKQTTIPDNYLEVHIMPTSPVDIGIREIKQEFGVIQIDIVVPQASGVISSSVYIDLIIEAFKRNTVIPESLIRIDKTPYASMGFITAEGKYKTPVTINYNKMSV